MMVVMTGRLEDEFDRVMTERMGNGGVVKRKPDLHMEQIALAMRGVLSHYHAAIKITPLMRDAVNAIMLRCFRLGCELVERRYGAPPEITPAGLR